MRVIARQFLAMLLCVGLLCIPALGAQQQQGPTPNVQPAPGGGGGPGDGCGGSAGSPILIDTTG
jgi:hypothetical protein